MKRFVKGYVLCFTAFLLSISGLFAQEGFLRVTSVPDGASIEIAGKNIGKTPILTVVKPGEHEIKATLAGYNTHTETVNVKENEVAVMQVTLVKSSRKSVFQRVRRGNGNLTVITDRENVDVYINGVKVKEKPPATIKDVPAGLNTVILVSGEYADSSRVIIQEGKTAVIRKSFEDDGKMLTALSKKDEEALLKKKAEELELKRQALPAKIVVRIDNPAAEENTTALWGESDSVTIAFQYRKTGESAWNIRELQSKTALEDTFSLEKGSYEIQITSTHYKEPTGIINIFLGAKKEKIKEYRETIRPELKPDVQYTYTVSYDGKTDFSYKVAEEALNTPVE